MFNLTNQEAARLGEFRSVDDAKRAVPQVTEWRQDDTREMGWNGWVVAAPWSRPDFMITFTSAP